MMSPSVGIWQRLTTVFTSRWFIAIMIPRPGSTRTPSIPAMSAIWPAQAPVALTVTPRVDVELLAGARVAHARAGDLVALAVDGGDRVVGEDPAAALLDAVAHRPHGLPDVDVGVRAPGRRVRSCGFSRGSAAQRLGDRDLLAVDAGVRAALREAIGVGGVVPRRGDEQAAGVLDAVGGDAPQDPVLADALLGGRAGP